MAGATKVPRVATTGSSPFGLYQDLVGSHVTGRVSW